MMMIEKAEMRLWSSGFRDATVSEINPAQHDFGGPDHLGMGQWHARNLLPESDAEVVPDFELQSLVGTSHVSTLLMGQFSSIFCPGAQSADSVSQI